MPDLKPRGLRFLLWIPSLVLAGVGCVGIAGLLGAGQSNQAVGWILILPAIAIGLMLQLVGAFDLGKLLLTVQDGFPVLTVPGVLLIYFSPAAAMVGVVEYVLRSGSRGHERARGDR